MKLLDGPAPCDVEGHVRDSPLPLTSRVYRLRVSSQSLCAGKKETYKDSLFKVQVVQERSSADVLLSIVVHTDHTDHRVLPEEESLASWQKEEIEALKKKHQKQRDRVWDLLVRSEEGLSLDVRERNRMLGIALASQEVELRELMRKYYGTPL